MKKNLLLLIFLIGVSCFAQSPKREFRSMWFQTVYGDRAGSGGDWPKTLISQTGNTSQIENQKKEFITRLDKLHAANVNAICFQARSRSDAMYRSSYEPWSADLVATRGLDPGYDPLEFVVEECHKRGMECHVWINPYRYESSVSLSPWDKLPNDYRNSHPDWLLQVGDASILDPGLPEVRTQVINIIKEIIENYDVDGVMFDDYFYLSGVNDKSTQDKYKPAGKDVADWRRENVNQLIAGIYSMIQDTKPYIRFGIGPAGIWGGDAAHQNKYDVYNPPGISGGFAFGSIYCDPVAWFYEGTIDYLTPQIYWPTAKYGPANTDYETICKWWNDVASKFGRHLYVSQSAARIVSLKWPYEDEVKVQVELARKFNHDGATGMIYFNTKNFQTTVAAEGMTVNDYFGKNIYTQSALPPAMSWKDYIEKKSPINIRISGSNLLWDAPDPCRRYSVYAIPNEEASKSANFASSRYLLGMAYGNRFDLTKYQTLVNTHQFGVACLDDYANEFAPGLMGYIPSTNQAAVLISPAKDVASINPCIFAWRSVSGAEYYVIEISENQDFSNVIYRRDIADTQFFGIDAPLKTEMQYYWRVRTRKIGVPDAISEVWSFSLKNIEILTPVNNATDVEVTPLISWVSGGEGYRYTLQVSTNATFTNIQEFADIQTNSFTVPADKLFTYSSYYLRVKGLKDGYETAWSEAVKFSTVQIAPEIPEIIMPKQDDEIFGKILVRWKENPYAHQFFFQMSPEEGFPANGDRISGYVPAYKYQTEIEPDGLYENTVYYVRIRAHYGNERTVWSPLVSFLYVSGNSVDGEEADQYRLSSPTILNSDYVYVMFNLPLEQDIRLYLCDATGQKIMDLYSGFANAGENQTIINAGALNKGIYLLVMETKAGRKSMKLIK